jgi:hypothetical protein
LPAWCSQMTRWSYPYCRGVRPVKSRKQPLWAIAMQPC